MTKRIIECVNDKRDFPARPARMAVSVSVHRDMFTHLKNRAMHKKILFIIC